MKSHEISRIPLFTPPSDYQAAWCVAGGKGGTKKTTTAFHTALALSRSGKTLVYDTDPKAQSLTLWRIAYEQLTGKELPFHVIQYTATHGLAAHAQRTRREMNARHLVFDIGGDTDAQYRQALRVCDDLILPISISAIETITLNATLATATDVAADTDRAINAHVVWCGVDHNDHRELQDARETAADPDNNWPCLETYVPYLKRYRHGLGTCPTHTGAYENVTREILTGHVATAHLAA